MIDRAEAHDGGPTISRLVLPLLRATAGHSREASIAELKDGIANSVSLSEADKELLLPSGQQTVFSNRLNWAKSYMGKAGLLESTRRGYFRLTQRGLDLLAKNPLSVDTRVLSQYPEFIAWKSIDRHSDEAEAQSAPNVDVDPEESMAVSFGQLTNALSTELVDRIRDLSPAFFERLIIDLLLAMKYGGGRVEMAKALGRSGDGGIDGVVKEDELGLDVVYIQAKRYGKENGVPVREVRDFVGSLEGHRATKGVFVTTSFFPQTARDFVERVSKRVILIDGQELSRLMIRHGVGVRTKNSYEVKKIDEDYFEEAI